MSPRGHAYWAPLDGLRAVAVAAVIAFHLGFDWASAGFLGVDLFFVISGFLITTLLVAEHDRVGRIAPGDFWERRIRRLVPAAVVMIACITLATRLWLVEERWTSVRGDALASLAWVANWRYIADGGGYFERSLGPSPLEHTWSLAVEEQFYLVWPIVMIVVLARWRHRPGAVLAGLLVAAAASAIWMARLYDPAAPDRAYQGTDTRAQQLLVGAALAWIVANWPDHRIVASMRARSVVWGAVLVLGAVTVTSGADSRWLFSGGLLLLSIAGATLVASCTGPSDGPLRLLAARPVVAVGRRSYGLYLWHWPVIVLVGAPIGLDLPRWPLVGVQLAIIVVATELSYRFVERPVRLTGQPRRAITGWVGAAAVCAAGTAVVLPHMADRDLPVESVLRPAALSAPTSEQRSPAITTVPTSVPATVTPAVTPAPPSTDVPPSTSATRADTAAPPSTSTVPPPTTTAVPDGPTDVLVVGDSTAVVLAVASWEMTDLPWRIEAQAQLGCHVTGGAPLPSNSSEPLRAPDACLSWRDDWAESAAVVDPEIVVVSIGPWEMLDHSVDGQTLRHPSPEWRDHVRAGLEEMLRVLRAPDRLVVVLRLPCMTNPDDNDISRDRRDTARVAEFNSVVEDVAAGHADVATAPLDALLCPDPDPEGRATDTDLRLDGVHLTPEGGARVWRWLLEEPWADGSVTS